MPRKKAGEVAKRGTFWMSGSCSCGRECQLGLGGGGMLMPWESYRVVGDEVVHVVAALPPADGQPATKVANEHGQQAVDLKAARDGEMRGIMRREHDLVPEQAQEEGRGHPPLMAQCHHGRGEQQRVPRELLAILEVGAVVEALVADALVQGVVLGGDVLLDGRVQRGVVDIVAVDLLGLGPVGEGGGVAHEDLLARGGGVVRDFPDADGSGSLRDGAGRVV